MAMGRLYPLTRDISQYERFSQPRRLNSARVVGGWPPNLQSRTLPHEPVKHGPIFDVALKLQLVLAQIRPIQLCDTHSCKEDWGARRNPFVYGPVWLVVRNAGHISYGQVLVTVIVRLLRIEGFDEGGGITLGGTYVEAFADGEGNEVPAAEVGI